MVRGANLKETHLTNFEYGFLPTKMSSPSMRMAKFENGSMSNLLIALASVRVRQVREYETQCHIVPRRLGVPNTISLSIALSSSGC